MAFVGVEVVEQAAEDAARRSGRWERSSAVRTVMAWVAELTMIVTGRGEKEENMESGRGRVQNERSMRAEMNKESEDS